MDDPYVPGIFVFEWNVNVGVVDVEIRIKNKSLEERINQKGSELSMIRVMM